MDDPVEWLEILPSHFNTSIEAEENIHLQTIMSELTVQQRKVIMELVLKGATESEVATKLGISQPAVNKIKHRAFNKLKCHLSSIKG